MPHFPSLPENAATSDIWQRWPDKIGHLAKLNHAIMRNPSPLSPGERELIAAYSSAQNNCAYCYGVHSETARAFGIEEGLFEKLMDDPETAPVNARLRPILAYVKKLTLTPARLTRADAEAVFAAGWDEDALHDAVLVCAMFNFMNRVVEGHGIRLAPEELKKRGVMIMEKGYDRPGKPGGK